MKLLLLALTVIVIIAVVRNYRRRSGRDSAGKPPVDEAMVRCEQCGVHLPRSESVLTEGRHYCSLEHAAHTRRDTGR